MDAKRHAAGTIAKALDVIVDAYWIACDVEGKAIHPADVDAPEGLLDDSFEYACQVEEYAARTGMSWSKAKQFV